MLRDGHIARGQTLTGKSWQAKCKSRTPKVTVKNVLVKKRVPLICSNKKKNLVYPLKLKITLNLLYHCRLWVRWRGSADGYASALELTRDVALRALELAACQTAPWKKSSKSGRQTQRWGRRRATEDERQVTGLEEFSLCLLSCSFAILPSSTNYSAGRRGELGTLVNPQQIDTGNLITWGPEVVTLYHSLTSMKKKRCFLLFESRLHEDLSRGKGLEHMSASRPFQCPLYIRNKLVASSQSLMFPPWDFPN